MTPRISVVIPCFNHGEFVHEAVDSVLSANREDIEAIVVDDGSTDERTLRTMDELRARGTRVLRQENNGLAVARNTGIGASRGEYIFPLDADDRMRTGWIDRAVKVLGADRAVGVVYGDAECFGARAGRWRTNPFDAGRLLRENYIHASALYRRTVWEQNGGYQSGMPVQGLEDWDFWLGAHEHGWRFAYIPEIFFEYRQAEGSMIERAREFQGQVEEFTARKHGVLYRRAWLDALDGHLSIKRTARHLARLVFERARHKVLPLGRPGPSIGPKA